MGWQWSMGLALCFYPISKWLQKRYGMTFAIFVCYLGISTVSIGFFSQGKYQGNHPAIYQSICSAAISSLLMAGILFFAAANTSLSALKKIIPFFTVANALYVIYGWLAGTGRLGWGRGYVGFLDYAGSNGCLIASCMGFIVPSNLDAKAARYLKSVGYLICIGAVILSMSAIPWGVLTIVMLCITMSLQGFIPLILGFGFLGHHMMQSSFRFEAYRVFMTAWYERALQQWTLFIFGTGFGSFPTYVPEIQRKARFMVDENGSGSLWFWLHSCWLQSGVFELGLLGFFLMCAIYFLILKKFYLKKDKEMLSLSLGLGATALLNFPTKYFATAFLIAVICAHGLALEKEEAKDANCGQHA